MALNSNDMTLTKELLNQLREMNGEEWFALAGDMGNIHIVAEKDAKDWHNYSRERRIETTLFYLDDERGGNKIAETICALRNNIIPLLDEIERLQGEVVRLQNIERKYKAKQYD